MKVSDFVFILQTTQFLGNIKSDGSECAYNAGFLSKKPYKDGEKNMEYSVKLKTKNEKYNDNIFYIVARNLDDVRN